MACLMRLFRLPFRSYVALAPFVVGQAPWFASTLFWWCSRHDWLDGLVFSCWISLIGLSLMLRFCVVVAFVFAWLGSSLRGHLVRCYPGCDGQLHASSDSFSQGHLVRRFVVVAFVFAWSWSQLDEWVSWLPKTILMLLEGGAARGWRCLREALLEGGTARGWRWLFAWIDDPRNICDHC